MTLSHLRHELRTALNHILGYAGMLADAEVADGAEPEVLTGIRHEANSVLQQVESCLGGATAAGSGSTASDDDPEALLGQLQREVREPLQRLIRLAAQLTQEVGEDALQDALRISSAASRLLTLITLGNTPVRDRQPEGSRVDAGNMPFPTPGTRLLVVDDDEANREILSRSLGRKGYEIDAAESGEDALALTQKNHYDLVLLDVRMPGMDGVEVLQAMKERQPDLPVVMISAFDEMANVVSCIQAGAVDYLFKPFNPVLLRARLAATLERKRLLDAERARARELELVTQELRRSNEDLERFAWAVSHDLQAPLRTMVSFLQLVQRRLEGKLDPETGRLIDDAVAAGKRMSNLVKDLLDYSQLSTRELRSEHVALHELVSEIQADLQKQIEEAGAEIRMMNLPVITADRVQLRQIFQNLIGNAIKYRAEGRPAIVTISAEQTAGPEPVWRLHVADNGVGIRREDVESIFQMFRRLHGPEVPGSGIGLATCQRIAERLGGRIRVRSEPGAGSVFTLEIPRRKHNVTGST